MVLTTGYVEKVLDKINISNVKPVSTPLTKHLSQCPKTDAEVESKSKVPYVSAVDCLMHAIMCTRPDLTLDVSQVCKFMSDLVK